MFRLINLSRFLFTILLVLGQQAGHAQIIDTVCAGTGGEVYRVISQGGDHFFWKVECGEIVSPPFADSIVVNWCNEPGIYDIQVVALSKYGCPGDTFKRQVLVRERLQLSVNGPFDVCKGETVYLNATGAKNYFWNTGAKTPGIVISPDSSGIYTVYGTDGDCVSDSATIQVNVYQKPIAKLQVRPEKPTLEQPVYFEYSGKGATSWSWYINDTLYPGNSAKTMTTVFGTPGEKYIKLVVRNEAGCTDTVLYHLNIGLKSTIFVPTAFTPNGDGLNDVYEPVMEGIESLQLQIYDRWGALIYSGEGLDAHWDGTYKGDLVPEGVFLYVVNARGVDGQGHFLKGNVTVIY